ncbi:MAG: hypothetical protein EOP83_26910 [Verrucomicrobiaceae bacterium]|nr:MAG: hypothetical protein EOP83_26910 [Verrucomicrobiaceae bacterium]
MELSELRSILDQLEPGITVSVPKDWVSLNVQGVDGTERDLKTIELALAHDCTWERDPEAKDLKFAKQQAASKGERHRSMRRV